MSSLAIIFEINSMAVWLPLASMVAIVLFGIFAFWSFFKKCEPQTAMVRSGNGATKVAFSGLFVMPIFHKLDIIDLTEKELEFELLDPDNETATNVIQLSVSPGKTDTELSEIAAQIGGYATFDAAKLNTKLEPIVQELSLEVIKSDTGNDDTDNEQLKNQIETALTGKLNGYTILNMQIHKRKPPDKAAELEINLSPNTPT